MKDSCDISVVIPVFNEEESVARCVPEAAAVLSDTGKSFEILVVDDGSTDGTFPTLRRLRETIPQLVIIRFEANAGQTAAFSAGFDQASGKAVVTMDGDLQNDPSDIPALLEKLGDYDVVCGYRKNRRDSVVRRLSSRVANAVRNRLTGESIRDTGCSLKAFKAEHLGKLKLYTGMHRFFPTLLRFEGCTVTEVPVNHRPRTLGKSKYGIGNRLFRSLRDLMAVRWMKSRLMNYSIAERIDS
jgi:glycosyltransferase involved in cell wall biosynthesis